MKRLTIIFLLIICMGVTGCSKKEKQKDNNETKSDNGILTEDNIENILSGKHYAEIEIIDYGTIKVELDADSAPVSVTNFVNLAKEKFYDGLTFHRIIDGFVIQGGDPSGNGTGGSDKCIKGEFINNGVDNQLSHTRGALSMARSSDYDSASSQFFIVHKDSLSLNGEYAVFGYVVEGIEIVDDICSKVKTDDPNGMVEAEKQPTIKSVTITK